MDQDLLYRFFDGKATPDERKAVKEWVAQSEEHKATLFKERTYFDAMILSGEIPARRATLTRKRRLSPILLEISKVAAVAMIVLFIGTYFYSRKMEEIRLATNTVLVPVGQRVNLRLPDGTNVWLNAGSRMTYPAYFSGEIREIDLSGEAYFEVTHNPEKPFIVHAKGFDVRVLGTKFNVKAYQDSDYFTTALMEGSVEVTDLHDKGNTVRLLPDQKVDYREGRLHRSSIEDYDIYRWREGLMCFKETRFDELMRIFENSYGIRIIINNDVAKDKIFSGKLRVSDGIENGLRILQKDGGYRYEWDESKTILYIK